MNHDFRFVLFLFGSFLYVGACSPSTKVDNAGGERVEEVQAPAAVYSAGALRNVMAGGDLSLRVDLDTLQRAGLVALGPLGRLQGEITVLDGSAHVTQMDETGIATPTSPEVIAAPFLAWAYVKEWKNLDSLENINDLKSLEKALEQKAEEKGISLEKAFAFQLSGELESIQWHVISKPLDEQEHTHDLHKQAKVEFQEGRETVQLVGFYSRQHEGIFTHRGDYIHLHVIFSDGRTGHVDGWEAQAPLALSVGF